MGLRAILLLMAAAGISYSFTLEQAIHVALSQRGDIAAAHREAESAEWSRNAARGWFLPQVNFSLAYMKNHDVQEMVIPGMGAIPMGSEWSSSYGMTAAVPLILQGPAGASLAGRAMNLAELNLESVRQDAVQNVINSFYGCLLAEMMALVATEALDIAREGYLLAERRYSAGTISRFELLQSSVAYQNRRPDSIAASAASENARAAFAVSIGERADYPFVIEGDLTDPFPLPLPESLESARAIMEENSLELAYAEELRNLGDARVNLAAAAFGPQLVFQTSYSYQAAVDDISRITGDDYTRNWTTSASLQIPVFRGLNDYADYRSATAERAADNARSMDMEHYSSLALIAAWNALEQARQTVGAALSTMGQAEEAAEIARVSYEAGIITRLDMDGAFLALTQARTNYASALYSLKTAEAGLARAMGILRIPEDHTTLKTHQMLQTGE
jgi:outer membrane protein